MTIRSMVGALGIVVLASSCGDDNGFTPRPESVAGPYYGSTFRVTQNGITADILALGGSIDINLASDGLVTGHLFVPNGEEGGGDLDLDLGGTWELNGTVVTFDMPNVNTFVRDMPFTVATNTLTGDRTFSQARIQLVLTKRPTA
ncbi:MAG TPA: hypothetical protein VFX42_01490 [Gemmatimonadales bacterium]|nr:hypothetical protein [Gemmatimonadales bacterium]